MTTKTVELYTFDELSDEAKERARQWWRDAESEEFGSFGDLTESAETAGKLLGIEFDTREVKLMGGGTRQEPEIYWQLHSQGEGAAFNGRYRYVIGAEKAIRKEFGKATTLCELAHRLTRLQRKYFYGLTTRITANSRYMSIHVDASDRNGNDIPESDREELQDIMLDFAHWIYKGIDDDYTYRMMDENVDDSIKANGYTFTEDGRRED